MARRNVRLGNTAQMFEDLLRQRIEQLRAELEGKNVANRELDMSIVLLELLEGSRRAEDLPVDVLLDVSALVDKSIQSASDRLNEMAAAQEPLAVAAASPAPSGGEPRQ